MTVKVEVDVHGTAFGSANTWTDESSALLLNQGVTVTWGRNDQSSDVSPSQTSFTLKNDTGAFTPGLTSGANYPYWRRRVPVRVSTTISGTTVYLFTGYADSLTVVPGKDTPTVCQVSATDILGRFGGTVSSETTGLAGMSLRSFLAEEMLVDSPSALYMLQEAEGSTSFADVTGVAPPMVIQGNGGTVDAGQSPTGSFVAGNVVSVTNPSYSTWTYGTAASASWLSTSQVNNNIEMWVVMPTTAPAAAAALFSQYAPDGSGVLLYVDSSSVLNLNVFGTGGLSVTAPAPLDGLMHQIVVSISGTNASASLYVDGALVGSATTSAFTRGTAVSTVLGGAVTTYLTSPFAAEPFTGGFAFIGFYSSSLSSTRVQQHYAAGSTGFAGTGRTDQRVAKLLTYRPNLGSVRDTGLSLMGQQDIQGESLQQALFDAAAVEGGVVYADGQGKVNFRSRSRLYNPAPVLTLDCQTGCVDWPSQWREDTQNVVNDVTVTRNGGADQRSYNAASITQDGVTATTVTLDIDTDANALAMAQWIVANGIQPQITVTPLQVDILQLSALNPTLAVAVLQLAPMDCIQVTNCPSWAPASTMTFIVQGGDISLGVDAQTATLNTTPLPVPVVTSDGIVNGVSVATDTSDSTVYVSAP